MEPHKNPVTRPMFVYLMVLTFAQAVSYLGYTALYTNFAVEVVGLNGWQNGVVQSVREVPGLLSIGVIGLLLFMREVTITSLAIFFCGVGVAATGWFPSYEGLIICTLIMSFGFHYFEATNQSLVLQYFSVTDAPLVIGRMRSVMSAGSFIMGGTILLLAPFLGFKWLFLGAGCVAIFAGVWGFFQHPEVQGMPVQQKAIVVKKKYWLFYVLTCLAGARRQIFMVFSVFFLVKFFGFSVSEMSLMLLGNYLLSWILNPYIGVAINRFGEHRLLTLKYLVIICICVGYIFCREAWLAVALYIVDQILFSFTISIRTFFQKIAETQDIAPSMAVGVTVNHIAAVVVPLVGGYLWMIDYRIPFGLGVLCAVLSLIFVQIIPLNLRKIVQKNV